MNKEVRNPFETGPYLQAAMLCEQVLVEQDGVKSAIRIIDRVTRTVAGDSPPANMETWDYDVKLLLKFKSGSARGPMQLTITLNKPNADDLPAPATQTLNFEGDDDRGVDLVSTLKLQIDSPGLYWVDVGLEGHRVTRIPLRVVYNPQIIRLPPGAAGPPTADLQ